MNLGNQVSEEYSVHLRALVDPLDRKVEAIRASGSDITPDFVVDGKKKPKSVSARQIPTKPPKLPNKASLQKLSDVPRKPLSAYNLFFQLERENIINGEADQNYTYDNVDRIARNYYEQGKGDIPKRKHRKSHGKISFAELARSIANKWRALDDHYKALFEERASIEKARHHKEIVAWVNSRIYTKVESPTHPTTTLDNNPVAMTVGGAYPTNIAPNVATRGSDYTASGQTGSTSLEAYGAIVGETAAGTYVQLESFRSDTNKSDSSRTNLPGNKTTTVCENQLSQTAPSYRNFYKQDSHQIQNPMYATPQSQIDESSPMSYHPYLPYGNLEPRQFSTDRIYANGMQTAYYGGDQFEQQAQTQQFAPEPEAIQPIPVQWVNFPSSEPQPQAQVWPPNSNMFAHRSEMTYQQNGAMDDSLLDRDVRAYRRYLDDK